MKIAVIGGGAAGFFAAIHSAAVNPRNDVSLFEKSGRVLAKVRISGGGRCNVTHACFDNEQLVEFYPRGKKELRNAFSRFNTVDTVKWFESHGVKFKTEEDGRMFPVTDNSETIVQCLLQEANKLNVHIHLNQPVQQISKKENGKFDLLFQNGLTSVFDKVVVTTGGSANPAGYDWLSSLGHSIQSPVPSLFTFNIPGSPLKGLEGISSSRATVSFEGFKYQSAGPVLITHWGISGPAVLRLSAFAARWLNEKNYSAVCLVNWVPESKEEAIREELSAIRKNQSTKKLSSVSFHNLPARLWQRLCTLSDIIEELKCADINNARLTKLANNCCRMPLKVNGKTTFKEEFVTCGGVTLSEVNMQTMESRIVKGLFFAGEVLDIDGVTGGFNFQSAWTTGYLAGMNAARIN